MKAFYVVVVEFRMHLLVMTQSFLYCCHLIIHLQILLLELLIQVYFILE